MTDLSLKSDFALHSEADWHALVEKGLRGANFETLHRLTEDGIKRGPLMRAEDLPDVLELLSRTDLPLLNGRDWHIAAPARHPDLSVANTQLLEDLKGGASAIRIENISQIVSRNDLKRVLEGVFTDLVPIQLAPMGSNANILDNALNIDPLNSSLLWLGLDPIQDQESIKENLKFTPSNWRLMGLSPVDAHEAGGTDALELAVLAASLAEAMRIHGAGTVCQNVVIDLAADRDTHLTIAKFRAARRLVRRIANVFGEDGTSIPLCAITSLRMMQTKDAWTNLLRVMSATFGAVIGGADMVTTRPFTDGSGHATPFAHRIARNMQLMMMEESHLGQVSDAAHGSFWHESLSENLAQTAWQTFQKIEASGGMSQYKESGALREELEASIESRNELAAPVLGITLHPAENVKRPEVLS